MQHKLGFNSISGVYNYLNKERLINLEGDLVYLVTHPLYTNLLAKKEGKGRVLPTQNKAIYLVDLELNTATRFSQVKFLLEHLNLKATTYSPIKQYLLTGKPYKNRFKFIYEEFFNPCLNLTFS